MERTVEVKPKSQKARNRLINLMDNNPICVVEQDTGTELFLASQNRKYFFWVSLRAGSNRFGSKQDAHWEVIFDTQIIRNGGRSTEHLSSGCTLSVAGKTD